MMHNVVAGPSLIRQHKDMVYAIILYNMLQAVVLLAVGLVFIYIVSNVVKLRTRYIVPAVLVLATMGTYSINGTLSGPVTLFAFTVLGVAMIRFRYPVSATVVGLLIGRLVLADCVARFSEPGREAIRQMGDKAEQAGMGSIAEIAARRIYHDAYVNAHPEEVERRREALVRMNRDTFIRACRITERLDLKPQLKTVNKPTLVVYGELDQATPPALNGEVASAIGAKSVAIPNCGHCRRSNGPTPSSARSCPSWRRPSAAGMPFAM
jgi:hypothetical protein